MPVWHNCLWSWFCCFWNGYGLFDFLSGVRVGEAANPGPEMEDPCCNGDGGQLSVVKFTVCNPSAIFGKTDEFRALGGDLVFVAETSATATALPIVRKSLKGLGYRSFFSKPVSSLKEDSVARPSLRGEALGTAVLSKLPSRPLCYSVDPVILESSRVAFSVVRFSGIEILCASLYGFANSHPNYKRLSSHLLMYCFQLAKDVGLPLIVGGDFNVPVQQMSVFDTMRKEGFFELHEFVYKKFKMVLPHTCGGATSNDTLVFHPMFADLIVDAWVDMGKLFHLHDPVVVKLHLRDVRPSVLHWKHPSSWAHIGLSSDLLNDAYNRCVASSLKDKNHYVNQQSFSFDTAIQQWAHDIENAVSRAVGCHHDLDPLRMPFTSLPKRFRGRCHDPLHVHQSKKSPGHGSDGSYDPPCEVSRLRSRQKIRQVRRISSLLHVLRKGGDLDSPSERVQGLLLEWDRICRAPGYGDAWYKWVLSYEAVAYIPMGLPSVELLDLMRQITKIDCDAHCTAEAQQRKSKQSFNLELDLSQGFSRASFRMIGKPPGEPLLDFKHQWSTGASLLRLHRGEVRLQLDDDLPWTCGKEAVFGDANVVILQVLRRHVVVKPTSGTLPSRGRLVQDAHVCTHREIDVAFRQFWSSFWLRDSEVAQHCDDEWVDVIRDIDALPDHIPPCVVDLGSASEWRSTALSMKSGKAIGYDGFRAEELHMLPLRAFEHLAHIVCVTLASGISPKFLCARTVLLAKVAKPEGINHGRPITIFGVLIRLISKHMARQILAHWARYMPVSVSGGLPGRGVQDLVLAQQAIIEKNVLANIPTLGYTLDLVKAFNILPRRVVGRLLTKLGVPIECVSFWLKNLGVMTRRLQLSHYVGSALSSTTGCPEGDCLAVVGMVAFSYFFHYRLSQLGATVFTYADNWSWLTCDERVMLQCFHSLVQIASSCKLTVDYAKSWAWGTNKRAMAMIDSIRDQIPGGVHLVVKNFAKDLGVTINYSKQRRIGPFRDRFDSAMQSFQKVAQMDIPIDDKARLIQGGLFPRALYGAEYVAPSEEYFRRMRRQVCKALVSDSNHASADIACHFVTKRIQDPFVYVLLNILRNLRRVMVFDPTTADEVIARASTFSGRRSCGPGSALAILLRRVGWRMDGDAVLHCGEDFLELKSSCNHDMVEFFDKIWSLVVLQRCLHRKGFDENKVPSHRITRKALCGLEESDKKVVVQYVTGSFQSESVKAMWDKSCDGKCPLCGIDDTKDHRLLHCAALDGVRAKHGGAVDILRHYHPDWIWAPLAISDPHELALRKVFQTRALPGLFEPVTTECSLLRFYTDGSADYPAMPWVRKGAFSVVQDISWNVQQRHDALADMGHFKVDEFFHVVSMACCPGRQSVPRAELAALLQVVMSVNRHAGDKKCVIFTDASYVVSVVQWINSGGAARLEHKVSNLDLVLPLQREWCMERFSLQKVKAHVETSSLVMVEDKWNAVGNNAADVAAKMARYREHPLVVNMVQTVIQNDLEQSSRIVEVFKFFATVSKTRMKLLAAKKLDARPETHDGQAHEGSIQFLLDWEPQDHAIAVRQEIDPRVFQAITCGNVFGSAVWDWLHTISWNTDTSPVRRGNNDPGITWLELVVNFTLLTGIHVPLIYNREGQIVSWMWPDDSQAELLPAKARSVASQVLIFAGVVKMLQSLSGVQVVKGPRGEPSSLWHLGFRRKRNGFCRRPVLLRHDETLSICQRYLQGCHPAWDDIYVFHTDRSIPLAEVSLPPVGPKERWNLYLRLLADKRR